MTKTTKIFSIITGFAILISVIFFAINSRNNLNPKNETTNKTVKISNLPLSSSYPLFIAKEKGFLEKNGVNVELTELANSNLNADAVQTGSVDLNFHTNAIATIGANEKDPNKVLIYSVSSNNLDTGFDAVFVKSNSEIKNIQQFAGKKIGVFPGNSATNTLKVYLKNNNVDISKIEFVQLPPANQKNALDTDSIDALFTYEPLVSTLRLSKDYTQLTQTILFEKPDASSVVATINKNFLKNYPELAKATIKSIDEGIDYIKTNPKESRQIIAKYVKTDSSILDTFAILNYSKSAEINQQKVQEWFDYMVEIGDIKTKINAKDLIYKP
jgi:NitT/TauT family transport system substrate-binding protein